MSSAQSEIGPPGRLGHRVRRPGGRVLRPRARLCDGGSEVRGRGATAVPNVQSAADPRGPPSLRIEEGHDPGAVLPSVPPRSGRPGDVLRPQRRDRGLRGPRGEDRHAIHLRPVRGFARDRTAAARRVQAGDREGEGRDRRGVPAEGRIVYVPVNRWRPPDRTPGRPDVCSILHPARDRDGGRTLRLLRSPPNPPRPLAHAPERRIRRTPTLRPPGQSVSSRPERGQSYWKQKGAGLAEKTVWR